MEYEVVVTEGPHTGRIFSYAGGLDTAQRLATHLANCRCEVARIRNLTPTRP